MSKPENARIRSIFLGPESHNIPSIIITCEQGPFIQGYGGYDLRGMDFAKVLTRLLSISGANEWGGIAGNYIRIDRDGGPTIERIGHIIEDIWFDFRSCYSRPVEPAGDAAAATAAPTTKPASEIEGSPI